MVKKCLFDFLEASLLNLLFAAKKKFKRSPLTFNLYFYMHSQIKSVQLLKRRGEERGLSNFLFKNQFSN